MKEVFIGQIVNTHGLKGELRIVSNFKYKDSVFKQGFKIYVGKRKEECIITSYRHHKIYDMVMLEGIDSIDDAIAYKGDSVYINRDDLQIDGYLVEDIIGFEVFDENKMIGTVSTIVNNGAHDILVVENEQGSKYMIPMVEEYIKKVDLEEKKISIEVIEGLLHED